MSQNEEESLRQLLMKALGRQNERISALESGVMSISEDVRALVRSLVRAEPNQVPQDVEVPVEVTYPPIVCKIF